MGKPDIIKTPSGDQMVILPLSEYQRLLDAAEEAEDLRAYDRVKGRLAAGEEELMPAELVKRILEGENKVRAWREYRGLTVKALGSATGLAAAYISQIETDKREGTIETFRKLATALNVEIDDIA